jgi:ABC-type multidrug transport system fused ATPase/permease subunit
MDPLHGKPSPYMRYINVLGKRPWLVALFFFCATYCFRMTGDSWITFWTRNVYGQTSGFYLGIFALWVACFAFCVLLRGWLFSRTAIATSMRMHDRMLDRVLHRTLGFFQDTPLAQLVTAFSQEQVCALLSPVVVS